MEFKTRFEVKDLRESGALDRIIVAVAVAIDHVRWPPGSDNFTIHPERGTKRG